MPRRALAALLLSSPRPAPARRRTVPASSLLSYTRWSGGQLDIFYIIESGRVVFDLLDNTPVSPPWEFE